MLCIFHQSHESEVNVEPIIAYIQREYHLPPLTYSLKLLLEERVLTPFACWVRHICFFLFLFLHVELYTLDNWHHTKCDVWKFSGVVLKLELA